jgi:Lon protease-like protein
MADANTPPSNVIPIFPLAGALLLPHSQLPLNVFENRYIQLIDDVLRGSRHIGMIQPREGSDHQSVADKAPLYDIGCVGRLTMFQEYEDGRYFITLTGIKRFKIIDEVLTTTPYRQVRVDYTDFEAADAHVEPEFTPDRDRFMQLIRAYVDVQDYSVNWEMIEQTDTLTLVNAGAALAPWEPSEKQALLEAPTMQDRYDTLITLYEMAVAMAAGSQGKAN